MTRQGRSQTTLRRRVEIAGVGVHNGEAVSLALNPAEADSGISFLRTDLPGSAGREIPAHRRFVVDTDHSTRVARNGVSVGTIEHLMASFRALGVDNALVEIDGPEVPIMDGSAVAFVEAIDEAGIAVLQAPRRYIKVLKPIRVDAGRSWGELLPAETARIEIEVDFAHPLVRRQGFAGEVTAQLFRNELARARTFGFLADVERLWAAGLARGATLENCVVLGDDRVVNPEGLRFDDEFARHKALDAVGDLALAGAPIIGAYRSYRGGHALNLRMLEALFADSEAYSIIEAPGRVLTGQAGVSGLAGAVAFGPKLS